MNEPIVAFDRVSKHYPLYRQIRGVKNFLFNFSENVNVLKNDRFEALRDISFEVYRGENFGIIGNNGAGKSTTLGLIAGVLKPNKGRVIVNGRISPLLSLGAGFHPDLEGRENIVLNGVLMGLTRREILKKMDEIIEFSELGEFIDRPIRVYSSGMLARLGFSIVAHLDPEILLIDEVLGVGDIRFQKKCVDKMMTFQDSHVTMIIVSHSIASVAKICDRVMWIENHTIKMIGDPIEVAESYCRSANVKIDLGTSANVTVTNSSL
ncbi:ABC transporter ATP-binding protein [Oscillatoria sp. FACHB-1407]|uniref:ABC transporter ATP-binding protein n=1 Tax=Oscillatoria sp. FACHB-1407 TaxID=2692847 RepID=UPI001685479E|nr:ABC transporter ATP-binding protein [Oscillatoria sp. FACHB-1407]MBD2462787.1 ABC transporter ATP-binding protein [Oscillatoria sp. FACHB-1407]